MTASPLIAEWQAKFDKAFPHGALMYSRAHTDRPVFPVIRPEVVGMAGLDPLVKFPVNDGSLVIGPYRMTSYADAGDGLHQFTFADADDFILNASVPEKLGKEMAAQRQAYVSAHPHGGDG